MTAADTVEVGEAMIVATTEIAMRADMTTVTATAAVMGVLTEDIAEVVMLSHADA
jgi:spore coat protein CotF